MAIRQHVGALFTDLYEVTMAQAYWAERMSGTAVFEIFFRKLPPGRSYIMAAGLADVVEFLEAFRFDEQDLRYLRGLGQFSDEFLRWLAGVRFTGDVWAAPEGTVIFPNEPAVQLIAPIIEAQLVETFVLNQIHLQSAGELARAGGDHRRAFDAYEKRLRPFIEGKQASAAKFIWFFATRTRFGLWFRNVAMRTMNFGPLATLFAGSVRDDFELPDYTW